MQQKKSTPSGVKIDTRSQNVYPRSMPFDDQQYVDDLLRRALIARAKKRRRVRVEPPKPGDRSGMLTVVKYNPISHYCECYCDCGRTAYIEARYIRQQLTKSCGCRKNRTAPPPAGR